MFTFKNLANFTAWTSVFLRVLLAQTASKDNFTLTGGVDLYYSFNFNRPSSGLNNYFVSQHKHNEFNVNLAYFGINYNNKTVRFNVIPAAGTYMEANYAGEPIAYRNLLEAHAGVKLFKNKQIWLDVGILPSPIGDENYFSKDQLTYTRSFASEYTPYYLTGAKLTLPLHQKLISYVYVVNGWQQIADANNAKSVLAELAYKPNNHLSIDYNVYTGNQQSSLTPFYGNRLMHNFYVIYKKGKWEGIFNALYIAQQYTDSISMGKKTTTIASANTKLRYALTKSGYLNARVEFYEDHNLTDVWALGNAKSFNVLGFSVGYDHKITEQAMLRAEYRNLNSDYLVFETHNGFKKQSTAIFLSLNAWF
jgi:hypothetical protein